MSRFSRRREIWLASVFALSLMGSAGAADLAVKAPIVAPVAVFTWTGVYLGIGGGTGWGNKEYSWDQDALAAALIAQGAIQNPPGPLGPTQGSHPISGGFFGGQLGANWQVGWAVFGVQADAHWADIEGRGSCFDAGALGAQGGIDFNCNDKVSSFGTVTGRIGAAIDRALIYAKGGWAWEQGRHDLRVSGVAANDPTASITASSLRQSRTGWTFGAGIEYAFAPHWSAFVEYDYLDFGTKGANSALIFNSTAQAVTLNMPIIADATEKFSVVKAGVNYKFSWWGAPVVARY